MSGEKKCCRCGYKNKRLSHFVSRYCNKKEKHTCMKCYGAKENLLKWIGYGLANSTT